MHTIASAEVLTFVSIGLLVGLVVVLVLQVLTSKRVQQLTLPMYEYAEAQSRAEAEKIIREARAAAATIIAEASSTSAALAKKRQEDIDAFAAAHKTSLETIAANTAKTREEGAARA